jgi:ferredoxin
MKIIKGVRVLPGCISCGTCEVICPKVFHIKSISCVNEGVNFQDYQDCINEAAQMCPVDAIEILWAKEE